MNAIILEIVKSIVIPELARYIRMKYQQTGTWPTKKELEDLVNSRADEIKKAGEEFLNRSNDTGE